MVCVGFSELFGDLLNKLEIESINEYCYVDRTSYNEEKKENSIEMVVKEAGHSRRIVHIVDEKYGIDGFYVSDPTWDNDLKYDYYNHLIMTNNEVISSYRYNWNFCEVDGVSLDYTEMGTIIGYFLGVNNIDEFYEKLNFLFSRRNLKFEDIIVFVHEFCEFFSELDSKYCTYLRKKYNISHDYDKWLENSNECNFDSLILELGEYIVQHVNIEISGDVIMKAVFNVYMNGYGYSKEKSLEELKKTIKDNYYRQKKFFPKREIINANNEKIGYINELNKFDIKVGRNK